jgi:hypothetical protein
LEIAFFIHQSKFSMLHCLPPQAQADPTTSYNETALAQALAMKEEKTNTTTTRFQKIFWNHKITTVVFVLYIL